MLSLWNDQEAANFSGDLNQRVYTSRLLGKDKSLVMHGGGNTSVKISQKNIFGQEEDVLYVKGSGWDLETIETQGFTPVRLEHLIKLATLDSLSDQEMVKEMAMHRVDPSAPAPSVEAILHACIPFKFVDHTHADAVLAVTNTADGEARIREIYGDMVVIIPYLMPGFDLAQFCAREFPKQFHEKTIGMVLLKHGIFSFGSSAIESYERMITLVSMAENYLLKHCFGPIKPINFSADALVDQKRIMDLRQSISSAMGCPVILKTCINSKTLMFSKNPKLQELSLQGPITPDHVLRTKRIPMLGFDVAAYIKEYQDYFKKFESSSKDRKSILDPAPRVVIDSSLGMAVVGKNAKEAMIVEELYDHTIDVILKADAIGGYEALSAKDIFAVEYWDLEQAKLRRAGKPPPFSGEVALITGGASGIGRACIESFLARGASVVALDVNPDIVSMYSQPDYCGLVCDLTDEAQIQKAIHSIILQYGGIDLLVLNAGIFPKSTPLSEMGHDLWHRVMSLNLDSNTFLLQKCYPSLSRAFNGGRIVIIGSKNVPAPGPGAAAYSVSKAAMTQLARVAALEWGVDRIRINTLHPNAVFDTGLWSEEIIQQRAQNYGLSINEYKTNNLLKTEVLSKDVAELAAEMCGPLFSKTTGAQVPIDGGNERVV